MNATPPEYQANRGSERSKSETIARKLDETRAEVSQTLEALQAKISPGQILDRTLTAVRERGGAMASNLAESVRENPWPVVVTGMGLLWMIAVRSLEPRLREDRASPARMMRRLSKALASARARLSGAAGTLPDRTGLSGAAGMLSERRTLSKAAGMLPDRRTLSKAAGMFSDLGPQPKATGMFSERRPMARPARTFSEGRPPSSAASMVSERGPVSRVAAILWGIWPLSRVADTLSNRRPLSRAAAGFSNAASAISNQVAVSSRSAARQVRRAGRGLANLAQDQPLLVGALGLATLGAIISYARYTRSHR